MNYLRVKRFIAGLGIAVMLVTNTVSHLAPVSVFAAEEEQEEPEEQPEEEQQPDVEEGGQGHHEGEEQRADALGPADQPEDAADAGQADDAEERRGEEVLLDDV